MFQEYILRNFLSFFLAAYDFQYQDIHAMAVSVHQSGKIFGVTVQYFLM